MHQEFQETFPIAMDFLRGGGGDHGMIVGGFLLLCVGDSLDANDTTGFPIHGEGRGGRVGLVVVVVMDIGLVSTVVGRFPPFLLVIFTVQHDLQGNLLGGIVTFTATATTGGRWWWLIIQWNFGWLVRVGGECLFRYTL